MRSRNPAENIYIYLIVWVLVLVLSACSAVQPSPIPTPTAVIETSTVPPVTPSATFTATPPAPSVILLAPEESEPALREQLQEVLEELSASADLQFQVAEDLSSQEVHSNVEVVVAIPPDPGIASLAASAPETQFLAVGIPNVQPDGNLSIIDLPPDRPDQLAFAAGYLAAAITPDWRVGVISGEDSPAARAAVLGFTNGVYFLCGLCRPVVPPFPIPGYPLFAQLPLAYTPEERQSALDYFQTWQVSTVYVAPEAADPGLLKEIADAGMNIIGTGSAPSEARANWVASIGPGDLTGAVQQTWQELLDEQGGQSLSLPLALKEVNPQLLSPGRQRLVEEMLADLQSGYIDTGVDPETGESRWTE